jgi:sulfur-oxidizing protein SoxZ
MADSKPRVKVPKSAAAGEAFAIKTLIGHDMESGQRKDKDGNPIPRQIINRFTCDFNGTSVIDMALEGAISANPYIEFDAMIDAAGTFTFNWYDDDGSVYTATNEIALA